MHATLAEELKIPRGTTAVIGSGGKTTLLRALSASLNGTVLLCTSTHILPFPDIPLYTGDDPDMLHTLLDTHRVVCAGLPDKASVSASDRISPQPLTDDAQAQQTLTDDAQTKQSKQAPPVKLCAPPLPFSVLETLADYVLVEADGAKRLPLKAHAPHEPVIPAEAKQTILVVGASGLGHPVADVVHRPEIFCDLTGLSPSDITTPGAVATAIRREHLADTIFINQAGTIFTCRTNTEAHNPLHQQVPVRESAAKENAQRLAAMLTDTNFRCVIGSLSPWYRGAT